MVVKYFDIPEPEKGTWLFGVAALARAVLHSCTLLAVRLSDDAVPRFALDLTGEPTADELVGLSLACANHHGAEVMEMHRIHRFAEINSKSEGLLRNGFLYPNQQGVQVLFSLSNNAQNKYAAAAIVSGNPATFPMLFDSKDDLSSVVLTDIGEFNMFYGSAMLAARTALGSGSLLKQQVRDALTHNDIVAVVDAR